MKAAKDGWVKPGSVDEVVLNTKKGEIATKPKLKRKYPFDEGDDAIVVLSDEEDVKPNVADYMSDEDFAKKYPPFDASTVTDESLNLDESTKEEKESASLEDDNSNTSSFKHPYFGTSAPKKARLTSKYQHSNDYYLMCQFFRNNVVYLLISAYTKLFLVLIVSGLEAQRKGVDAINEGNGLVDNWCAKIVEAINNLAIILAQVNSTLKDHVLQTAGIKLNANAIVDQLTHAFLLERPILPTRESLDDPANAFREEKRPRDSPGYSLSN